MNREDAIAAANKPPAPCSNSCNAKCDDVQDQLGALIKAVQDLATIAVPAVGEKIEEIRLIFEPKAAILAEPMELREYNPDYGQIGETVASQVTEAVKSLLNSYLAEFVSQSQPNKRTKA